MLHSQLHIPKRNKRELRKEATFLDKGMHDEKLVNGNFKPANDDELLRRKKAQYRPCDGG